MLVRFTLYVGLVALLVGCADSTGPSPADANPANGPPANGRPGEKPSESKTTAFTHTITNTVEYYKGGPQQAQPPDGEFKAGTLVNILEEAGSYTLVRSEDGIDAYVASDALKKRGDDG